MAYYLVYGSIRVQGDITPDLLSDMDMNKIDNLLWLWELALHKHPYLIHWTGLMTYAQDRRLTLLSY